MRGDVLGAAVEQVVAVDHRHHDVLEASRGDGAGHVLRLAHVDRAARIARRDRAKRQPRVHIVAESITVAVPSRQHSPTFGQRASSQTVWRSSLRNVSLRWWYVSPPGARTSRPFRFGRELRHQGCP